MENLNIKEIVKSSRDIDYSKIKDDLTLEEKDLFCAIMADSFNIKDQNGTLVDCMYRLFTQFEVKRKK